MQEETFHPNVQAYFLNLGYNPESLQFKWQAGNNQILDLVVLDNQNPFIVVEFKNDRYLFTIENLNELRFHPFIRQIQSYAISLNAPYFVVTNSEQFMWFKTDESGRPFLLSQPISPQNPKNETANLKNNESEIINLFINLRDLVSRKRNIDRSSEAATLILAKILSEQENKQLHDLLLSNIDQNIFFQVEELGIKINSLSDSNFIYEAVLLLDQINLTRLEPLKVISAIDKVFFQSTRKQEFRINRWLADFLVKLAQLDDKSVLLDISSNFGDVLAAAWINSVSVDSVWGISSTIEGAIWTKIQQLLLGQNRKTIFEDNALNYNQMLQQNFLLDQHKSIKTLEPTHIISAPSFGQKNYDTDNSFELFRRSSRVPVEDLYLELAINWVKPGGKIILLVPEGLLFGGNRRQTRQLIKNKTEICAIISLPNGALLPYSSIKSSILILEKKKSVDSNSILMAEIDELNEAETFDSSKISKIFKLLQDYNNWTKEQTVPEKSDAWIISSSELLIETFTANYYKPIKEVLNNTISERFNIVPLYNIIEFIKRGKAIKLDKDGETRVLGPAAIRPLNLDVSNLDHTSNLNLPSNAFAVEIGDVIVNNISTYLGSAAIVTEDIAGALLSHHALLIRPNYTKVLPEYLAIALNSNFVNEQIQQRATGSIMPSLSTKRLEDIKIPLPPIAIQKEISEKILNSRNDLHEAEAKYEEAKSNFTNAIKNLFD